MKNNMSKKLIRIGVFETNSSSCHSVSIADETKEFVLDTIYPDQNGIINLLGGEFGWEWFKHNDALTKANYAAVSFMNNEIHMGMLFDVIKEQTGAEEVIFLGSDSYDSVNHSYIDHDSYGTCPLNKDDLKNFIFNKNSWLFGGNDNSTAEPTFYHVPEFKGGRQILPEYKYVLTIEGIKETTKFINEPSEDEIRDGLNALLEGVKLYDDNSTDTRDSKGYYFDNDNSLMSQLNRRNGYFEFSTWKRPIDYTNGICYFQQETWNVARGIYEQENPNYKDEDWSSVGYSKVREIEKRLETMENSPYVREVKFTVTPIENKNVKKIMEM